MFIVFFDFFVKLFSCIKIFLIFRIKLTCAAEHFLSVNIVKAFAKYNAHQIMPLGVLLDNGKMAKLVICKIDVGVDQFADFGKRFTG